MALDDAKRARLAELLSKRADAEKAEKEAAEERELEAEELALTLEAKLGGKRGEAFALVNNRFGVFALRKPDLPAIRRWENAKDKEKESLEWMLAYLGPYIEPQERATDWKRTSAERPGLCWQTANAMIDLMGVDRDALAKK